VAGCIGLGLAFGGWRAAALAALIVAVAIAISPWSGSPVVLFFGGPILVAGAAVVTGLAARARRRAATAGAVLLACAVAGTAWGVYLDHRVVDRSPERPVLVDERTTAHRGIRVGMETAEVRRVLPNPVVGSELAPLGPDDDEIGGPTSITDVDENGFRYRDLVVMLDGPRVTGYVTTDDDAQTRTGVGVGDSLELAKRRYRNLGCDEATFHDSNTPEYPFCEGDLGRDVALFISGDPIDSLWVYREPEIDKWTPGRLTPR
jgi:hypothetical protein